MTTAMARDRAIFLERRREILGSFRARVGREVKRFVGTSALGLTKEQRDALRAWMAAFSQCSGSKAQPYAHAVDTGSISPEDFATLMGGGVWLVDEVSERVSYTAMWSGIDQKASNFASLLQELQESYSVPLGRGSIGRLVEDAASDAELDCRYLPDSRSDLCGTFGVEDIIAGHVSILLFPIRPFSAETKRRPPVVMSVFHALPHAFTEYERGRDQAPSETLSQRLAPIVRDLGISLVNLFDGWSVTEAQSLADTLLSGTKGSPIEVARRITEWFVTTKVGCHDTGSPYPGTAFPWGLTVDCMALVDDGVVSVHPRCEPDALMRRWHARTTHRFLSMGSACEARPGFARYSLCEDDGDTANLDLPLLTRGEAAGLVGVFRGHVSLPLLGSGIGVDHFVLDSRLEDALAKIAEVLSALRAFVRPRRSPVMEKIRRDLEGWLLERAISRLRGASDPEWVQRLGLRGAAQASLPELADGEDLLVRVAELHESFNQLAEFVRTWLEEHGFADSLLGWTVLPHDVQLVVVGESLPKVCSFADLRDYHAAFTYMWLGHGGREAVRVAYTWVRDGTIFDPRGSDASGAPAISMAFRRSCDEIRVTLEQDEAGAIRSEVNTFLGKFPQWHLCEGLSAGRWNVDGERLNAHFARVCEQRDHVLRKEVLKTWHPYDGFRGPSSDERAPVDLSRPAPSEVRESACRRALRQLVATACDGVKPFPFRAVSAFPLCIFDHVYAWVIVGMGTGSEEVSSGLRLRRDAEAIIGTALKRVTARYEREMFMSDSELYFLDDTGHRTREPIGELQTIISQLGRWPRTGVEQDRGLIDQARRLVDGLAVWAGVMERFPRLGTRCELKLLIQPAFKLGLNHVRLTKTGVMVPEVPELFSLVCLPETLKGVVKFESPRLLRAFGMLLVDVFANAIEASLHARDSGAVAQPWPGDGLNVSFDRASGVLCVTNKAPTEHQRFTKFRGDIGPLESTLSIPRPARIAHEAGSGRGIDLIVEMSVLLRIGAVIEASNDHVTARFHIGRFLEGWDGQGVENLGH